MSSSIRAKDKGINHIPYGDSKMTPSYPPSRLILNSLFDFINIFNKVYYRDIQ